MSAWSRSHLGDFLYGAMALIDGDVGVGVAVGVGVRDGDAAEGLASEDTGTFGCRTIERFEQTVVFVGVAVGPAIDRNGFDIGCGIEASGGEHASKLVVNVLFEGVEFGGEEFPASG